MLVTPYLVEPMNHGQVPPTPGDEVKQPNDLEFYFLNRIEARTGKDFRATTAWDDIYNLRNHLKLEKKYVNGPWGSRSDGEWSVETVWSVFASC